MKKWIFPLSGTLILMVCILSSFGVLSDTKMKSGQNKFGGYGRIYSTGNYTQRFFYDDKNFYYLAWATTWDHSAHALYAYDLETGESYSVCKRISCTHETADCPVHPMYQGENTHSDGVWNNIDGKFVSMRDTKKKLLINLWDPMTGKYKKFTETSRFDRVSDEMGMGGEYQSFYNDALRVNDELIMVGYNNEMHVLDSDGNERFKFPSQGLRFPLTAGNKFCWLGAYFEMNFIDLETGEIETTILDEAFRSKYDDFGEDEKVKTWDYPNPFCAFSFGSEIFFPRNDMIYAFDPSTRVLREVTAIDTRTEEDPYACFNCDNVMYYKLNGIRRCMDLNTGTITDVPDLPKIPCAAVGDKLLYVTPDSNDVIEVECYDKNGKQVHP